MAKFLNDAVLDAALDHAINNADKIYLFDAYSTDYATINTNKLAEVAVVGGDFTKANGDTSGRKAIVAAKTGVNVTADGNYNHLAIVKSTTSTILAITDGTTKALNNGDTVDIPTFDIEVGDPA